MKKFQISNLKFKIVFTLFTIHCSLFTAFAASDDFRKRTSQETDSATEIDDVKAEVLFGRELAARILGRYQLYRDKELTRYINLVGKSVSLYANRPEIEYRFAVLDTDIVNAFAAPGGYIFVTRGALKLMDDEAELAAVLAHEVAHVTEKHIVKELGIKASEESAAAGFARLIAGSSDTMRAVFTQMVDKAVEILFEKGLKKQDEMDSDRIAAMTIAGAGYDPAALSRYLKKVSAAKNETKLLLGTHPSFEDRIKSIDTVLAENQLTDKKQPAVKERFNANVKIK